MSAAAGVAMDPLRLGAVEIEVCSIGEAEVLLAYPESLREWLAADEERTLERLATPKRKRDWLAARLAAKRVAGRRLAALGRPQPAPEIRILNAPSREPFVALGASSEPSALLPISLAHASDYGACALAEPGARLGMDLERIEPRDPSWRDVMADASELGAETLSSSEALTRLWAAKEAVLKLLGVGLSVDLREVRLRPDGSVALSGAGEERWSRLGRPPIRVSHARYHDCCLAVAHAPAAGGED